MLDFPNNPNTGDLFVGYQGDQYEFDGVKWVNTVGGSGIQYLPISGGTMQGALNWTSTGSTASRAAQDRTADVANVLDFGAVGDGVTDNLAAFQAADASGKVLYVPPGTYIMSQVFWLHQGMFGVGMGRSIIKMSPTAAGGQGNFHLVVWFAPGPATVRDITFDGSNWSQSGITTAGTLPQAGLRFERVEAKNIGWSTSTGVQNGILINWDETTPNTPSACVITDCYVHDCPSAMGIGATGQGIVISNNTVVNCGHSGIGCYDPLVDGVIIGNTVNTTGTNLNASADGITGYGYTNNHVLIVGNTVENSTNHGIHIGGNNIQINDNKIHTVINGSGIMLQSSPNTAPTPGMTGVISGNEIDGIQLGSGIRLGWHNRVVVNGNSVSNIAGTGNNNGIEFLVCNDCICTDNIVYNCSNAGIAADTSINLIVCGNRIDTVANIGIVDRGLSTGMIVYGNTITNETVPTAASFSGTISLRNPTNIGGAANISGALNVSGALTGTDATLVPTSNANWGGYQAVRIGSTAGGGPALLLLNNDPTAGAMGFYRYANQLYFSYGTGTAYTNDIMYLMPTAITMLQPLVVNQNATFQNAITANGALTVNGAFLASGAARTGGELDVGQGANACWQFFSGPGGNAYASGVGSGTSIMFQNNGGNYYFLNHAQNTIVQFAENTSNGATANYMQLLNAPSGSAPIVQVAGTDANANLQIYARGTGIVQVMPPLAVGTGQATVNSGTGAPATTRPVGSIYMRTDGAVGSTLYVSRGAGTWAAVAGV